MLRLFDFLRPHKKLLVQLVIINVLLSAMLTAAPLIIKQIVDQVIDAQQYNLLLPYLGALVLITVIRTAATYFYSFGQNKLGQLVMTGVRTALYRKLLALPYSFYDKEQTGRLMSRVSSDVESTRIFLSQILIESMSHVLTIGLASIAFLQQDPYLTLIAVVPILVSGAAMYYAHHELTEPWTSQHERMAQMSATLQDNLAGIKVVKAFAQEEQAQGRFQEVQGAVRSGSLSITDLWSKRWALIGRAMLLDPRMLILDDSMSAVDAETEQLLQAAIATVMEGRTTILVAHRLATAQRADHIIVLRDGQIVEQGTHAELDAAGGHYHHVLEMQQMSARESLETA